MANEHPLPPVPRSRRQGRRRGEGEQDARTRIEQHDGSTIVHVEIGDSVGVIVLGVVAVALAVVIVRLIDVIYEE